jgi:hypothetical protein
MDNPSQIKALAEALRAYGPAHHHPQQDNLSRAYVLGVLLGMAESHQGLRLAEPQGGGLNVSGIAKLYELGWDQGSWSDLSHESGAVMNLNNGCNPAADAVITPEILDLLSETGVPVRACKACAEQRHQTMILDVQLCVEQWDGDSVELAQRLSALVLLPVKVRCSEQSRALGWF